jgi:hypothetical protein
MTRASDVEDRRIAQLDRNSGEGIEVIDWSAEERGKFRKIASEAWSDAATKSELAKEAYDAHIAFMKQYGLLD